MDWAIAVSTACVLRIALTITKSWVMCLAQRSEPPVRAVRTVTRPDGGRRS